MLIKNNKGFTLVEMIVVMAIFTAVIILTGQSFNSILSHAKRLMSSEESSIEGVIGLEMMRHDLEQAGYGLPWVSMQAFSTYDEAAHPSYSDLNLLDYNEVSSAPHNLCNDGLPRPTGAPASCRIPRAFVALNNLAAQGTTYAILDQTDYLAIKATSLGQNTAAQRWTYVTYSGTAAGPAQRPPNTWVSVNDNIPASSRVILTRREAVTNNGADVYVPMLLYDPTSASLQYFYQTYPTAGNAFPAVVSPLNSEQMHYVYGVGNDDLRMPFNRVNYFIARPSDSKKIPSNCAPNTGILYRTSVNHSDGSLTYMPVLDCVADMQVVLGFNFDGSGTANVFTDPAGLNISNSGSTAVSNTDIVNTLKDYPDNTALTNASNHSLRDRLKVIKVYILVQDGRKNPSYVYRNPKDGTQTIVVGGDGEASLTRTYDMAANNALNYNWKVYQITAKPKNLAGFQ